MKGWRAAPLSGGERQELLKRLDAERLEAGDYARLRDVIRETRRLRLQLWWMDLAKRVLLGLLAVKNWVRRCQGKAPLVVEEGDEEEC